MSKEGLLYYFAVWLLWCANSLFHLLDVDGHLYSPEVRRRTNVWTPSYMDLVEWLADERFFPIDAETMNYEERKTLYRVSEDIGDAFYVRWRDQFLLAAQHAYEDFPELDKALHLYFYYCRWLLNTLSRFDDILQMPDMQSSEYFHRYQENKVKFEKFAELLREESPVSNTAETQVWKSKIEELAEHLADEWQNAVHASAAGQMQDLL